jgi:hypothetical protein
VKILQSKIYKVIGQRLKLVSGLKGHLHFVLGCGSCQKTHTQVRSWSFAICKFSIFCGSFCNPQKVIRPDKAFIIML